jgi:uncharacterized membrane protein
MLSVSSKAVKENKLVSDCNERKSNKLCRKKIFVDLLLLLSILCLFYQIVFSGHFLFLACIFRTFVISRFSILYIFIVYLVPASQTTIYITDALLMQFRKIMDKN